MMIPPPLVRIALVCGRKMLDAFVWTVGYSAMSTLWEHTIGALVARWKGRR